MSPQVTVVIPTLLSHPQLLSDCLATLSQQNWTDFEVVLVVNQTEAEAKLRFPSFKTKFKLTTIFMGENAGFATAMNVGINKAQANLIVALNDDTTVDTNWLAILVETHKKTGAAMVASNIYLADKTTLDSQGFSFAWRGKAEAIKGEHIKLATSKDYWLKPSNSDLLPADEYDEYWQEPFGPDAAACLYTREMLAEIGMFDESFFAYLEDVDLALRARQAGYSCVLAPKALVWHHKHATSSGMSGFKHRQDMKNWWRVVGSYKAGVWRKFWWAILVERLRNAWGYAKR